jgi:quercetin dioxygenase-like cupin family protein
MSEPRSITPSEIDWKDQPALSPGAKHAVLLGDPSRPGAYLFRLRVPPGHRVMPHSHPEDRVYTVLEGTLYIGFGPGFESSELMELPEGSVVSVPAGTPHFQSARSGGYLVQIAGSGPTSVTYVREEDDPRRVGPGA